jgi:hypothetical protein
MLRIIWISEEILNDITNRDSSSFSIVGVEFVVLVRMSKDDAYEEDQSGVKECQETDDNEDVPAIVETATFCIVARWSNKAMVYQSCVRPAQAPVISKPMGKLRTVFVVRAIRVHMCATNPAA